MCLFIYRLTCRRMVFTPFSPAMRDVGINPYIKQKTYIIFDFFFTVNSQYKF